MLYPAELQARAVILAGERALVNFRYPRRALKRARGPPLRLSTLNGYVLCLMAPSQRANENPSASS
jgi:hypothetical protein